MSLEKNVVVATSDGDDCFVCEKKIPTEDWTIRAEFSIDAILAKIKKKVYMHVKCADELHELLARRIGEARAK